MPKPLDPNTDITTTKTALHEALPITGSIHFCPGLPTSIPIEVQAIAALENLTIL